MRFVKIVDSGGETRWINLARVSRATLAEDASRGHPILVLLFEDPEARLALSGGTKQDKAAIDDVIRALDQLCEA